MLSPELGSGYAAARVHHAHRQRGGVAARRVRADRRTAAAHRRIDGLRGEGLAKLGWTEGRSISLDVRWATGERVEIERFAKERVARAPELILASTTPATAALLQQTRTIPIVFALVSDPVGSGFVASFARPGDNVTGFTTM